MIRLEKKNEIMRWAWKLPAIGSLVVASFTLGACHNANASKEFEDSALSELRPDSQLKELTRAVTEGDAHGFAALCIYPIQRPYPLKDIKDSTAMIDYFPILIDDSIRTVFSHLRPSDWERYGWRGWSFGDSQPVWYDEGIQFVNFESKAESGLRRILAREEIMSLAPQYRDGWTPVTTMVERDGGQKIYRIDRKGDSYRLMQFESPASAKGDPDLLMDGSMRTEGSAGLQVFEFSDSDGAKAEYTPDGEIPLRIFITPAKGTMNTIVVVPAYWRDYVR